MCTVSLIPTLSGVRLVCNRDERRSRPRAIPPRVHSIGALRAVFPVDPASGGTWIGANDAGLLMTLLNRSARARSPGSGTAPASRGRIIPSLLAQDLLTRAVETACALAPAHFEPFQLVIVQGTHVGVVSSDGDRMMRTFMTVSEPMMWTSSSLGDAAVERPRKALFDRMVSERPADGWSLLQDRFHRHRWPDHRDVSVVMSRPDTSTVSRTIVEHINGTLTMRYQPLGDERLVVAQTLERVA